MTRHDRVSPRPLLVHVELERPVPHERVELSERAVVQEPLDALARCQLSLGVLLLDRFLGGRVQRLEAQLLELPQLLLVGLRNFLTHWTRARMLQAPGKRARSVCSTRS